MPLSAGFYGYQLCFHLKREVITRRSRQQLQAADWSWIYTNILQGWSRSDNLAGLGKNHKFLNEM